MANMSVVDRIKQYQRSSERCTDNELRRLHCIVKLYNLRVTVQHLKETDVGRTVNALRKFDGSVDDAAKALVAKWKPMVVGNKSSEEEDEAYVPNAPERYSDHSTSPESNRDNAVSRNSSEWPKQSGCTNDQEFSRHGRKNSSSSENSKPRKNEAKSSRHSSSDKYKCSKNGIDTRHTKSGTKSESKNDTRSESKNDTKSESRNDSRSSKKSKSSRDSRDSDSESRKDSISNEPSTSSKGSVRTEDSRKDSRRVSSSNSGSSKSSHNHDSDRKRKLDLPLNKRESSKRRKTEELPVQDKYDDPVEKATQVLSRDSDVETTKTFPDTSSASDEEITPMTKVKHESPDSSLQNERSSSTSGRSDKSLKSRSPESSWKSTSSSSGKSRRESDKNEKLKRESTNSDHRKNEKRKDRSPNKESSSKSKSHSSSSSSSKIRGTSKERDENSDNHKVKKNKSDCDRKNSKEQFEKPKEKKVKKTMIGMGDGIDCKSGASFAEALGMCTNRPIARKKPVSPTSTMKTVKTASGISTPSSSSSSSSRTSVKVKAESQIPSDPEPLSLLAPNVKLEPLKIDSASTLPEISPNHKPLPALQMNPNHRKQEESRALSNVIYAKTQRTKVYSGMKSGYSSVPTLCEEAIRVLMKNIHELRFTGGIPYDILKPVLERATPDELFTVENYNPYLIGDTDQLWQFHCNREFRTKKREEMESSRDMYLRCRDEREAKLKALTANIKESIDKSVPVRSAKLAYVDTPPRNVLRQQAKYGTAKISTSSSDLKKQMILSGSSNAATNIAVPPPPHSRHKSSSSGPMKKAKAPLMAKALQLIKGRYKR